MSFIREHIVKRVSRSSGWSRVRREHLELCSHCAVCGRDSKLEVHHIEPFSEDPSLELDPDNLLTLCDGSMRCHFVVGHLGDFRSHNPEVVLDAKWFHKRILENR